jgi:hypothetical protein
MSSAESQRVLIKESKLGLETLTERWIPIITDIHRLGPPFIRTTRISSPCPCCSVWAVTFEIYYVIECRRGEVNSLQSSPTRAVLFIALITSIAFGSLWLSSHPSMSSTGKLLALSLLCTLAAAAYQPALMGPPPSIHGGRPDLISGCCQVDALYDSVLCRRRVNNDHQQFRT